MLTPAGDRARPASATSQRHRPCTPFPALHLTGLHITRHQRGFTQFTRPVFPSPAAARMERAAASALPRASHPADQEPDSARRGGDRPTEHGPGTTLLRHQPNLRSSVFAHNVRPRRRNDPCESFEDPKRMGQRTSIMKNRRHTPEQVIRKLREADRLLGDVGDQRVMGLLGGVVTLLGVLGG